MNAERAASQVSGHAVIQSGGVQAVGRVRKLEIDKAFAKLRMLADFNEAERSHPSRARASGH